MADSNESWTGLTDQEAEEFHKYYLQGTQLFVGVAVVAHILTWIWRPWIPSARGYALLEDVTTVLTSLIS